MTIIHRRPVHGIPHHETSDEHGTFHRPEDQDRETQLADIIKEYLGLDEMLHLGNKSYFDYIAIRNGLAIAGVELISRNYSYGQLYEFGGVYLKLKTFEQAKVFAESPLSTEWLGVFVFYDLVDGLYYREVREMVCEESMMYDGRQARANDTELGVEIQNLKSWITWEIGTE